MLESLRRMPYRPAKISQLKEAQGRVSVLGTVLTKNDSNFTFIIDDGEARVLVITNDIAHFDNLEEGMQVRVLGKIMGSGDETEVLADFVQNYSCVNKTTYNLSFFSQ